MTVTKKSRKFRLAPIKDWVIDRSVVPPRRAQLLGRASFESIVAAIFAETTVHRIRREKRKTKIGFHRYTITLRAKARDVDLWHNSRGGYRAQYYIDERLGDAANAYAVKILSELAGRLIRGDSRRRRFWPMAEKSICHREARLWIHQGLWLRHARREDRLLYALNWQGSGSRIRSKEIVKLVRWGMLIPKEESKLVLKGQWLNSRGSAVSETPKSDRARSIARYGFT